MNGGCNFLTTPGNPQIRNTAKSITVFAYPLAENGPVKAAPLKRGDMNRAGFKLGDRGGRPAGEPRRVRGRPRPLARQGRRRRAVRTFARLSKYSLQ